MNDRERRTGAMPPLNINQKSTAEIKRIADARHTEMDRKHPGWRKEQ